jgi:hypothetical protein
MNQRCGSSIYVIYIYIYILLSIYICIYISYPYTPCKFLLKAMEEDES